MSRLDTNFHKDIYLGRYGEEWLAAKLVASNKTKNVIDISNDPRFHAHDIDLVQDIVGGLTADDVLTSLMRNDYSRFNAYEVKTDTQITQTGNICYELTSHSNKGCLARSKANYVVYTGVDVNNNIIEAYLIPLAKLRTWVSQRNLKVFSRKSGSDQSTFHLIKIRDLINDRIATTLHV